MVLIFGLILVLGLCALSWIDIKTHRIPNWINFALIALGVIQAWVLTEDVSDSLIGAILGYGTLVAVETAYKAVRGKDGIGRGDAKLLAAGGAWCGAWALPLIVLSASLSGIAAILLGGIDKKNEMGRVPFGPFLSLGIFSVWAIQHFA